MSLTTSRREFLSTSAKLLPAFALASTTFAQTPQNIPQPTSLDSVASQKKKVFVIATGGTIAGTADSQTETVNYTAAQLTVNKLLAGIPVPDHIEFEGHQLAQVDSKDMNFTIWRDLVIKIEELLKREDISGIVITHGTDTLEETALFLDLALKADKPVVMTAAMRPATALSADGPANLLDSITLAATTGARGVMCVLNGYIYAGSEIRKAHTTRIDAFTAGEAGALGAIDNGVIRMFRDYPISQGIINASKLPASSEAWPWVEILTSCAGYSDRALLALVNAKVDGIVIAATGNGTIHENLSKGFKQAQGVRMVRAGRVNDGAIIGADENGLETAPYTAPVKARVWLIVQLLKG